MSSLSGLVDHHNFDRNNNKHQADVLTADEVLEGLNGVLGIRGESFKVVAAAAQSPVYHLTPLLRLKLESRFGIELHRTRAR